MDSVPVGIITEQSLVHAFSSNKAKNKYSSVGHFTGYNKKTTLDYAANFCDIAQLPDRMYEIKYSFAPYVPFELKLIKTGIYNYITPLLLKALLNHVDIRGADSSFCKSVINLAREIDMVNDNYLNIAANKYNYAAWEDKLEQVHPYLVEDYFSHAWGHIQYYITNCLDKLAEAGLVHYEMPYMVAVLNHKNEKEYRLAEENDLVFRRSCQLKVLKTLEKKTLGDFVKDEQACRRSADRLRYNKLMIKELAQNKILSFFICYKIDVVPEAIPICVKLINSYSSVGYNVGDAAFIEVLNKELSDIINNAVSRRTDKSRVDPLTFYNGWYDYRETYNRLSQLTLFKSADTIDGLEESGKQDGNGHEPHA